MAAITTSVETYIGYTLSGSTVPTWTQLDDYIKDGIVDIVNKSILISPGSRDLFSKWAKNESATSGTEVPSGLVLEVTRENGTGVAGVVNNARQISFSEKSRALDPDSMTYAGKNYPVWYFDEDGSNKRKVVCLPVTSNSDGERYNVRYVHYSTTDTAGSALTYASNIDTTPIAFFPISLQPHLILYCAIRSLYLFIATEMKKNSKLFDIDVDDDDAGNTAESYIYWLSQEDTEMVQATLTAQQGETAYLVSYLQKLNSLRMQYDQLFGQAGASREARQKEEV